MNLKSYTSNAFFYFYFTYTSSFCCIPMFDLGIQNINYPAHCCPDSNNNSQFKLLPLTFECCVPYPSHITPLIHLGVNCPAINNACNLIGHAVSPQSNPQCNILISYIALALSELISLESSKIGFHRVLQFGKYESLIYSITVLIIFMYGVYISKSLLTIK